MRKLKIYLDTSVISYLKQDDAPDKMNDTSKFWGEIKQGKYDVYISNITLEEVGRCYEPKREIMFNYLNEIEFNTLEITHEVEFLANEIIKQGILTRKSFDDCMHIAIAVISECDIIASWNFKHIVNIKTINGVRAINLLNGYRAIDIYSPNVLLGGDA